MKKSSILSSLLVLFFICVGTQAILAAPQLEVVGGPTYDFGDVQANQTLTHTFVLKNVGDDVLRIQQAKGG